jgi:hypothetical protein
MSELIDGHTRKPSTNIWQMRHDEASVHNFLCSTGVVPDSGAAKDLELVIDYFNVFSAVLDGELPRPILSVIKATRAVLIENSLACGENSLACGKTANRRRVFVLLVSTRTRTTPSMDMYHHWVPHHQLHPSAVADSQWRQDVQNAKRVAAQLFWRHNVIVRSLDRLQKYRTRGIEVKPNDYPPRELERVLRKLDVEVIASRYIWEWGESTDEDSDEDSMNDSDDVSSSESSYGAVNKRESDEASRIRAVRLANDSEEARQKKLNEKGRVAEERKAIVLAAREAERWDAYRALVEEVKHGAWVASIPSLTPMGIILPDENELEVKDDVANTNGLDCHKRKAAALDEKQDGKKA